MTGPGDHSRPGVPHRPASVTLRQDGRDEPAGSALDPANQSLADALRLVFRGLQLAMVALLLVFAFSGFQTVSESEAGVRLLFGRVTADNLKPGLEFAAPYPFGELIKVGTGVERVDLGESFWPHLTADQRGQSLEKLAQMGKPSLRPGEDGSNITGDESIAHTRWLVQYRRHQAREFVENVYPDDETAIVRAAVERGIVHAVSQTTIDNLLKQTAGDQGSVAERARGLAQATLDGLKSGITIEQLTLEEKSPPLPVFSSFSGVQSAEQKASQQRAAAEAQARNILNAMAGGAYEPLVEQIDRYEAAIALGDAAAQEKILETINALLDGRPATIGDRVVQNAAAGQVAAILNEAKQYRSTIVSRRRGELALFQAKLAQFRMNPDLVIQRDWADAMTRLMGRDMVEGFWVPPGTERLELWLNRDQTIVKDYERVAKEAQLKKREEQTRREQEREAFKTRTDQVEMSVDLKER